MGTVFQIVRTEANGRIKVATHMIGGGGSMSASEVSDHLVAINAYPGAKSVEVTELDGVGVIPPKLEELRKGQIRRAIDKQLRPLTTPKATIKPKYVLPPELQEPAYKTPGHVPFAGDGLSLPASPVNSPAANDARENYIAAHGLNPDEVNLRDPEKAPPTSGPTQPTESQAGGPAEGQKAEQGSDQAQGAPKLPDGPQPGRPAKERPTGK